uniref:Lef-7 n=1 Tax=Mamestra configurata nucleopolyhedrovirus TaxID=207830 RepID=A0A5B9G6Z8_NPVMC|nr:lef-7 [Mamestra configurata nucleopolyhedrovirus A]
MAPKRCRRSARVTAAALPYEMKLKILEHLGIRTFLAVTGDKERADTLMLKRNRYKLYFETRPANYNIEKDQKLARHLGLNVSDIVRLPLLVEKNYECYVLSKNDDNYNMRQDVLINRMYPQNNYKRYYVLLCGLLIKSLLQNLKIDPKDEVALWKLKNVKNIAKYFCKIKCK